MVKTVLVLAANPVESVRVQFQNELSAIQQAWERSKDGFKIEFEPAATWDRWRQRLLDCQPEVVHFVGHGIGANGLVLEGESGQEVVSGERLAQLLVLFPSVRCVVLNACHSKVQAIEIFEKVKHVEYVIGMKQSIRQESARQFSMAFYDGLFKGKDYKEAGELGKTGIKSRYDAFKPYPLVRNLAKEVQRRPSIKALDDLEKPGGPMAIDSPFYVQRSPAEEEAMREIVKPGALLRIKAPHLFGKSSLMKRVVSHAETTGARIVKINFRDFSREDREDLNKFLKCFCNLVTRKLGIPNTLDTYWDSGLGRKIDCGEYFEDYLLTMVEEALVLELDEIDLLFEGTGDKSCAIDFLSMLRAWFEEGRDSKIWKKLRLVLVHTKDIEHETLEQEQSPFNVGMEIELGEFDTSQVHDLVEQHGLHIEITPEIIRLVGGHPHLVRLGLYSLARGQSLEDLLAKGVTEEGLYGDHLRKIRSRLERNPDLKMAFSNVLAGKFISSSSSAILRSWGIGKLQGNHLEVACDLYRLYFQSIWT